MSSKTKIIGKVKVQSAYVINDKSLESRINEKCRLAHESIDKCVNFEIGRYARDGHKIDPDDSRGFGNARLRNTLVN